MVMNRFCVLLLLGIATNVFSQTPLDIQRGPVNIPANGVLDGVVVKDEVPVRSRVEYEYVRYADYVWSKRLFSRIDAREKVNHPLFYPYDKFTKDFTQEPPKNASEMMAHRGWIRNQERLSLWTVVLQHLMNGDLSMFYCSDTSDFNFTKEDGYMLKYRLMRYNNNSDKASFYGQNSYYKQRVVERSGGFFQGEMIDGMFQGQTKIYQTDYQNFKTFKDWVNNLINTDYDAANIGPQWQPDVKFKMADPAFEKSWNIAMTNANKLGADQPLLSEDLTFFLTSDLITAFNIKEDWFFDKERSMLDKRIIAIAPVAKFTMDKAKGSGRGSLLMWDPFAQTPTMVASVGGAKTTISGNIETGEYELFWLYFPELRNVMVNYFVYNNQSDAQWMSFDDFFWKRMFSGTIYRASDQFDRDVEDYRYGVDALYEAEKIKENMRTWETDLWNY
jgi:hypothetical protein